MPTLASSNFDATKFNSAAPGIKLVPLPTEKIGPPTATGYFTLGEWIKVTSIDFGIGVTEFVAEVGCANENAEQNLEIRIDSPTGILLGVLTVKGTGPAASGGWYNYDTQSTKVSGVTGVHDLVLVSAAKTSGCCNLHSFAFTGVPAPVVPNFTTTVNKGFHINNDGVPAVFDFGDPTSEYNTLYGYNAAHIYTTSGLYTITITPDGETAKTQVVLVQDDTRHILPLTMGENLQTALNGLKTATIITLPNAYVFQTNAPIVVSTSGVTIQGLGPTKARLVRVPSAGSSTLLDWAGADGVVENVEFDSTVPLPITPGTAPKVDVMSLTPACTNLVVKNCNFRNVDNALNCVAATNQLLVQDCTTTNELRANGLYSGTSTSIVVLNLTTTTSAQEHMCRVEDQSKYVLIANSKLHNLNGKTSIRFALCQYCCAYNNQLFAWATTSDANSTVINAQNVIYKDNHFSGTYTNGAWLNVYQGTDGATIDSNTFDTDAVQIDMVVAGPLVTNIKATNNKQNLVNGAKTHKVFCVLINNPGYVESGTTVVSA